MIDLNLDAGEKPAALGDGSEARLYRLVGRVNIACGGHAGDETTMRQALKLAREAKVRIGAHPSYADRENFGRTAQQLPATEVTRLISAQVSKLWELARAEGIVLDHVKPHGALYNQLAADEALAKAVAEGVRLVDPALALVGLAGSRAVEVWRGMGFRVLAEAFADRRYRSDGSLTPRTQKNAVLQEEAEAVEQVRRLVREGKVISEDGREIKMVCDTICTHGDNPQAEKLLRAIRAVITR